MKKITSIILLLTIISSCFVFSGCELFGGGTTTTGTTTTTPPKKTTTSTTTSTTTTTKRPIPDVELEEGQRKYLFIDFWDIIEASHLDELEWWCPAKSMCYSHCWVDEYMSISHFTGSHDIYENGYYLHIRPFKDRIEFDIEIFSLPFVDTISELSYEFTSDFTSLRDSSKATRAVYVYNSGTLVAQAYYYIRKDNKNHTIDEYDRYIMDLFDRFFIIVSR